MSNLSKESFDEILKCKTILEMYFYGTSVNVSSKYNINAVRILGLISYDPWIKRNV